MHHKNRLREIALFGALMGIAFFSHPYLMGPPPVLSPVSQKLAPMDAILPALSKKVNTFKVYEKHQLFAKEVSAESKDSYQGAAAYLVMNYENGEVIDQKLADKQLPIASLTKVMTAVVALDLADPHERFTASRTAAAVIPTKIGVRPGEQFNLDELLHAVLLTSANDAAEVVKSGVNKKYGYDIFVKAMNKKAELLGLKDTHFANPQGFDDPDNYSTVRDLAILSHYALTEYPEIARIVKLDEKVLPASEYHRRFDLYNWNGLVGVYPNVFGVKIGNTGDAGTTMIAGAERDGERILAIVLGASNVLERDMWTADLLDLGFQDVGMEPVDVTVAQLQSKYATWKIWN